MGEMAKNGNTAGGVGGVSSFDSLVAASYSYSYDNFKLDHYLHLAFEAVCFACGCFTWSDIGIFNFSPPTPFF